MLNLPTVAGLMKCPDCMFSCEFTAFKDQTASAESVSHIHNVALETAKDAARRKKQKDAKGPKRATVRGRIVNGGCCERDGWGFDLLSSSFRLVFAHFQCVCDFVTFVFIFLFFPFLSISFFQFLGHRTLTFMFFYSFLDANIYVVPIPCFKMPQIKEDCPKCDNDELTFYTLQLRSVDEGQTVFYECEKCGYVAFHLCLSLPHLFLA